MTIQNEFSENKESVARRLCKTVAEGTRDVVAFTLAFAGGMSVANTLLLNVAHVLNGMPHGTKLNLVRGLATVATAIPASFIIGWQVGDKLVYKPVHRTLGNLLRVPVDPK
jgi:hypothetical protein